MVSKIRKEVDYYSIKKREEENKKESIAFSNLLNKEITLFEYLDIND